MTADTLTIESAPAETTAIQVFGFWIYLLSDLVLFSALFATFIVLSRSYAGGPTGKELFDLPYLFVETMFLLFSNIACSFTIIFMRQNSRRRVLAGLTATFLLGLGFITMEIYEFHGLILAGNGPQRSAFLSAFFTLVGTHGAHVLCGLIWLTVILSQIFIKGLTEPIRSRLTRLSMFWHFLDLVWVGVFAVVYLMEIAL